MVITMVIGKHIILMVSYGIKVIMLMESHMVIGKDIIMMERYCIKAILRIARKMVIGKIISSIIMKYRFIYEYEK